MSDISSKCGGSCNVSTSYNTALAQYFTSSTETSKKADDILKQFKTNVSISNQAFQNDNYITKTKGIYGVSQSFNPVEKYAADRKTIPHQTYIQ